ncbi:hypothetical protein OPKNFCMD_5646 [Methylobacterium crusticola]|uniref:Uncharacterized protein n=1 Tax=Methylobacterium crusticola TaxID=1697972 RepID=A0ABQ4R7V0_9HYPH|nr:hypothetical protein [Methylobacterium crusticola]GJD52879.1 hypothetical protein OPKNFCMD_5646 [Methylobacterium crusticola]
MSRSMVLPLVALALAQPGLAAAQAPAPAGDALGVLRGWTQEVRTVVAFKIPDEAAQKLMPAGWTVAPAQQGPAKGSNLSVVFREQLAATGPDGKPSGGEERAAVLAIPGRNDQDTAFVIVGAFSDAATSPGYYKVSKPATVTLERRTSAVNLAGATEEAWRVTTGTGETIAFRVTYDRGAPARAQFNSRNISAADPKVRSTYRVDQGLDPLRSQPNAVDRTKSVSFEASGGSLAGLFDGKEQMVAVLSLPWYSRQIYVPAAVD